MTEFEVDALRAVEAIAGELRAVRDALVDVRGALRQVVAELGVLAAELQNRS